jgi:NADH:ubiquinone oxidoreductase subunit 6 (subunit J)
MYPFADETTALTPDSPYVAILRNWALWLPLVLGGLAVYLLLPRPRPFPAWSGVLAGAIAIVLAGANWFRPLGLTPETVLFYAFSALAVVSGSLLVTQQNPARAALSFTLVILSTCGLFLLLAAPFLMAATIIVYAGAIIVTFLFVIMLAQQQGYSDADARSREPALAVLTGFLLLAVLMHVISLTHDDAQVDAMLAEVKAFRASGKFLSAQDATDTLESRVSKLLENLNHHDLKGKVENADANLNQTTDEERRAATTHVLAVCEDALLKAKLRAGFARPTHEMSGMSGAAANTKPEDLRRDPETDMPRMPADNAAHMGKSLFTDYLLPVELGGFLLLVATIGAIAIAHRKGPDMHGPPVEGQT